MNDAIIFYSPSKSFPPHPASEIQLLKYKHDYKMRALSSAIHMLRPRSSVWTTL